MQRIGANGWRRIITRVLPVLVLILAVVLDQVTKSCFKDLNQRVGDVNVIDGFFYFTYVVNTGAAWSFLSDVWWAQTFFKILSVVAIIGFSAFMTYAIIKGKKWLSYSLALIIGGTIGNFIDRLLFNGVTDFIGFIFGNYYFPVFNLADSFLVVGMIMLLVYFLFLDNNAVFKKSSQNTEGDKNEN